MATRTFRVAGTVIDAQAKKPVPNVRVEAWTNDTPQHVVLDTATADTLGRFQLVMEADVGVVGDGKAVAIINVVPVVLKVFKDNQMLKAIGDTSIPNLLTFNRAAALQVPALSAPQPAQNDRVTAPQALTAFNFIRRSDFVGVFNEGRDRATALGTVLLDSIKSAVGSVAVKPLQVSTVRNRDVINQDPKTASQRLEQQNIAVNQVIPYQPGVGTALTATTSLPRTLKAGDKVNLLVQNGVVRGYEVVTPAAATGTGTAALATEVDTLQANVLLLQTKTDDLEQFKTTISSLQKQLSDVQAAHNALAAELTPARVSALEDAVRKLQQGTH